MLSSPRQAMIVNGFSKLRLRDMAVSGNGENVAYLWQFLMGQVNGWICMYIYIYMVGTISYYLPIYYMLIS